MLVSKSSYTRDIALEHINLPTLKVKKVDQFGGLAYANEDFSISSSALNMYFSPP